MKKFTNLDTNNIENKIETKSNFIKSLIEESLTVADGQIIGIDTLSDAINRMFEMNESKAIIKALEVVKAKSYQTLNMAWINESIEVEKTKLVVEKSCCKDCEDCKCEKGECNCDSKLKAKKKEKQEDVEEKVEEDEKEILERIDRGYVFTTEYPMSDISEMQKLMESIKYEDELSNDDKLKTIIGGLSNEVAKDEIMKFIASKPTYESTDIEDTLNKLNESEINELYALIENIK